MLPFLVVAGALAGEPNALTELVSAQPAPTIAARCDSLGLLANSVEALTTMPLPDMPEALRALDRASLDQAGFDLASPVTLLSWEIEGEKPLLVRVAHTGDAARLEAWLRDLSSPAQRREDGSWAVGEKGGRLRLEGGMLELRAGTPPAGPGWAPPSGLIDDLPDEGCAFVFRMGEVNEKLPKLEAMALHVAPGEESELLLRVLLTEDLPRSLLREGRERPALGRSKEAPVMLLSLGVDPLAALQALLSTPNAPGKLQELSEPVDLFAALLTRAGVELAPGSSVALWRERGLLKKGPALRYAAVIPLSKAGGGHVPGGMLEKGISDALVENQIPITVSDGELAMILGPQKIVYAARRDRLYVASDADTLKQTMARLRGKKWGDREFRKFARDQALAFQGSMPGPASGIDARVGLRAEGPIVEFRVSGSGSLGASGAGMLAAIAIPNFVQMQYRAKRAEVPRTLELIFSREGLYAAKAGASLPLPPAPRAAESLDKKQVPWTAPEPWSQLGWTPDSDLRGTYWVEVGDDGTPTVHGMIDVDGDGNPAHYTLGAHDQEPVQLTPNEVY